jgi:hypothetical protein
MLEAARDRLILLTERAPMPTPNNDILLDDKVMPLRRAAA